VGPDSKQAVCDAIGHLIDAVQRLEIVVARAETTLGRVERMLAKRSEEESADLVKVNQRVTALERWRLAHGGKPSPA
jgi:hypothetical protein